MSINFIIIIIIIIIIIMQNFSPFIRSQYRSDEYQ
jgi:hypothetical protein